MNFKIGRTWIDPIQIGGAVRRRIIGPNRPRFDPNKRNPIPIKL
jgi:hypothetical protein